MIKTEQLYVWTFRQVDGIFEVQQFVNLSWRDPRISFHNLKGLTYKNSLLESEKQAIWIPSVTFLNTADQVWFSSLASIIMTIQLSILGTESSRQQILDNSWEIGWLQDQRGRGSQERVHLPGRRQHPDDHQGLLHWVALQLRDGQLPLRHTGKGVTRKRKGITYKCNTRYVQWFSHLLEYLRRF